MKKQYICFLLSLLIFSSLNAETLSKITLPEIKPMHGMSTTWIAEKIIYNAHPMSIRHFTSNKSSTQIINHYTSRWKLAGHGKLSYDKIGDYFTVGYAYSGYAYSVQLKDISNGTEGKLVVTRDRSIEQDAIALPVHSDAKLVSRIQSLDLGLEAETLTLSVAMQIHTSRQWYHMNLINQGWTLQDNLTVDLLSPQVYQKGKQLCQLLFVNKSPIHSHKSMVMIHWIKG